MNRISDKSAHKKRVLNFPRLMLILILVSHTIGGCKKDESGKLNSNYKIYTLGQYYDEGWKGCFWKNFERSPINGDLISITVVDLCVADGNIYIAGHYGKGGSLIIPCYWKNTERKDLAGGSKYQAYTCAICVYNGSVYTAGKYYDGVKNIPCYWKDTVRTDITDYPDSYAEVTDITVVKGDVYLSGVYALSGSSERQACYWKNGIKADLPIANSTATSIFVDNNDVYIAGGYNPNNVGSSYNLCYWKNSVKTDISPSGNITDIVINEGTVYTTGDDGEKPCFWKGTSKTVLNGVYRSNAIFVKNGDVFTTGYYINENDSKRPHIPCFWVGTQRYDLPVTGDPSDSNANDALAIYVE
jgi:hypothetical protein